MSPNRNKYDSILPYFFQLGKDSLIPDHIRKNIPLSTISTWRNVDYTSYYGHELRSIQSDALEYFELFHQHENLKKTIRVIARVWVSVAKIVLPVLKKKKEYQQLLVDGIQNLLTTFKKQTALKIANVSATWFHEKLSQLKIACGLTVSQLCLKKHPLQLAKYEVKIIKELFEDIKLIFWPAVSLYYEGLRSRNLYISLSTFYKYVNLLELKRKWKPPLKKLIGLRAKFPNQYLHVDTTFYEFNPGIKAAIVFVSDNFSHTILGWSIALKNSAENVKQALQMAIGTIRKYHPNQIYTTLVADGGSENHAVSIDDLLRETEHPLITKIIALKDVRFSNSPIEAVNKIAKRYLRILDPGSYEKLTACIEFIVHNYSQKRPHGSLKGLTPFEAYTKPNSVLNFSTKTIEAKENRIQQNRKMNCESCSRE